MFVCSCHRPIYVLWPLRLSRYLPAYTLTRRVSCSGHSLRRFVLLLSPLTEMDGSVRQVADWTLHRTRDPFPCLRASTASHRLNTPVLSMVCQFSFPLYFTQSCCATNLTLTCLNSTISHVYYTTRTSSKPHARANPRKRQHWSEHLFPAEPSRKPVSLTRDQPANNPTSEREHEHQNPGNTDRALRRRRRAHSQM